MIMYKCKGCDSDCYQSKENDDVFICIDCGATFDIDDFL
jgi:Fe2+ or Zn2+ uptake regulation protein